MVLIYIFKIYYFEIFFYWFKFYIERHHEIFSETFKHFMIPLSPRDSYEKQLYHCKIRRRNSHLLFITHFMIYS